MAEVIAKNITLHPGDCREVLAMLDPDSIDACVTDPPYHLTSIVKRFGAENAAPAKSGKTGAYARQSKGFMGKTWDGGEIAFEPETWASVLRVLKPGGHLLAFGAPKNFGFMQYAIAQAGFEMRDVLAWIFGSGFPKSHNLGDGWGTALKPAFESVLMAQKPYKNSEISDTIGSQIDALESSLWSMLPANIAEKNFGLNRKEYDAACASARWNADERNSTRAALSEAMGTARFVLALTSSLSTVSSWKAIWAASSQPENTSTIETELNTTIDLRTLSYLLSKITPAAIMQAHRSGLWSNANADIAERAFDATLRRLHGILEHSALANAIALAADSCRDGGAKPNLVPIIMARKPLIGTVARNIELHGTGAINIDGCRVATDESIVATRNVALGSSSSGVYGTADKPGVYEQHNNGRWPANVIHDGSEEVVGAFPSPHGAGAAREEPGGSDYKNEGNGWGNIGNGQKGFRIGDEGSAARFFYTAKADADDRLGSKHPTVKPVDLMQWLVRLVTPKGGIVLDPFAGTGTTGEAAFREGMQAILIERESEYQDDIRRRMKLCMAGPDERAREAIKAKHRDKPIDLGPLFEAAE